MALGYGARPEIQRNDHKGRVEITREFLGALFGLPENVEVDIYHDYARDTYNLVMRSKEPVEINGHIVTQRCPEGCEVPRVDGSFMQRVLIVAEDPERIDESYIRNAQRLKAKDNQ